MKRFCFAPLLLTLLISVWLDLPAFGQAGTLQFATNYYAFDEGSTNYITVERLGGSMGHVQVDYVVYAGFRETARAKWGTGRDVPGVGSDAAAAGILIWEDGDSAPKTFPVGILQDAVAEGDETMTMRLVEPEGGAVVGLDRGQVVILDDDAPAAGALHFSKPLFIASEGATNAIINVRRTGGSAGAVSANYTSASVTLSNLARIVAVNPATPGTDYTEVGGTVTWANGDTTDKTILMPILNDTAVEGQGIEAVLVTLSGPTGGAVIGSATNAYLYIVDDEPTSHIFQMLLPWSGNMFRIGWQPQLPRVRGLLFTFPGSGGNTRNDANDNSVWRNLARAWDFALVGGDSLICNGQGTNRPNDLPELLDVLDLLGAATPHPEVANAPMIFTGFSFGALTSPGLVQKLPSRVIAFGSDNGNWGITPYGRQPLFLEALRSVPGSMVMGSDDQNGATYPQAMEPTWRDWRTNGLPVCLPIDWNTTHQSIHGQVDAWHGHFFDQAVKLRYPAHLAPGVNPGEVPVLNPLQETNGWLGDAINVYTNLDDGSTEHSPFLRITNWAAYTGNRSNANWFPTAASAWLYRALSSRQPNYEASEPFQSPLKIIYPGELESFAAGETVTVIVDPRSLGNRIARLEFFDGTNKFGELTQGPWAMPLPHPGGVHGVVALATLTDGTQQSAFQTFLVEPPSPIRVFGNGQLIPNNDTSRSYNNGTLFNTNGGQNVRSYTIKNPGTNTLLLTGNPVVSKAGANQADFTVQQPPVSTLPPGGSTIFTVTFTPGGTGIRNASLRITNNAPTAMDTPYMFNIRGTNAPLPDARLWLPLDNPSGNNATDLSGYETDNTVNNGTWVPAGGRLGGALSFNGDNTSINVSSGANLNPGNALTLAVWIKPATNVNSRNVHLFNKGLTFQQYRLYYQTSARLAFWIVGQTGGERELFTVNPVAPPINAWTHIAATYDGATMRLYTNGVLAASQPFTGGPLNPTKESLFIGTSQGSDAANKWFHGLMDDVRAYGRALGAGEVFALANPERPWLPANLTATAVSTNQINLSWSDKATNETGFVLERKTASGGTYALLALLTADTTSYVDTNTQLGVTYYYRLASTNAVGSSAFCDEAGAAAFHVYETWQAANFTVAERTNALVSGPLADPDGDGLPNVVEYALGLAPKTASNHGLPFGELSGGFLTMTYTKSRSASDVILTSEVSTDLNLWQAGPACVEETLLAEDTLTQTIRARDLTPAASATNRFMRLKVTLP